MAYFAQLDDTGTVVQVISVTPYPLATPTDIINL